jgi:hypothetical protein
MKYSLISSFHQFPKSFWSSKEEKTGYRKLVKNELNEKSLLAMTYSPRGPPPKYHRR